MTTTAPMPDTKLDTTAVFQRFDACDFDQDANFQAGLAPILESASGKLPDDMLLLAKAFFYNQQIEPINLQDYKAWKSPVHPLTDEEVDAALRKQEQSSALFSYDSFPADTDPSNATQEMRDSSEMSYPASFADIVELIKSGKPVPGIQHIPDKLADEPESKSAIAPKLKPWQSNGQEVQAPSIFDSLPVQEADVVNV